MHVETRESSLFYHVDSREQTQNARLHDMLLLVSHLAGPSSRITLALTGANVNGKTDQTHDKEFLKECK